MTAKTAIRARKATLPDVPAVHALIAGYAREGLLLPRSIGELCENVRDFTVVEKHGEIIGCGALHLYGQHLAEVRSIAVARQAQGQGAGGKLVAALLMESRAHKVAQVCLFTRSPRYFARLGFVEVPHASLPDKIFKDCRNCALFDKCDETAMIYAGAARYEAAIDRRDIEAILRPAQVGRMPS